MSLLTKIATLRAELDSLFTDAKALLAKKLARASVADNALTVQGKTQTHLTNTVNVVVASHEANKANPHQMTAAQLGMLTRAQIDALLAPLMPQGQLAVSRYGTMDNIFPFSSSTAVNGNNAWGFSFANTVPIIMTGQEGVMSVGVYDLREEVANPTNKTIYVYVVLEGGAFRYRFSDVQLAESDVRMWVGTAITNAGGIASTKLRKVSRLMTQYRVYTDSNGTIEVVV